MNESDSAPTTLPLVDWPKEEEVEEDEPDWDDWERFGWRTV